MEEHTQPHIEDKIMSEIKTGKIKFRSRYVFWVEKFGIGGALVFSILLAVLLFSIVLFYFQATDNLWYLGFGSRGLSVFLEAFPYLPVIILVISIISAGFILKKSNLLYKKPFGYVALSFLGFVVVMGGILAFTTMVDTIEDKTFNHPVGVFFRPLFGHGIEQRAHGVAGRVLNFQGNTVTIQTPQGIGIINIEQVDKSHIDELRDSVFIIAIGKRADDVFFAYDMRIMDHEQMPMIQRGIERRFQKLGPPDMQFNEIQRACLHDCILRRSLPEVCFGDCNIPLPPQ